MKICIIGGGTAGWLAALMITRLQPGHKVTVIESSKIGIIGAGEGTTGIFFDLLYNQFGNLGIDEADFMRECRATQKMGIRFTNWQGQGESWISPIDNTPTARKQWDGHLMHHCLNVDPKNVHRSTTSGVLAEHNLSCYSKDLTATYGFSAYHFDGNLVGRYFKKESAHSCEVIDSEVLTADQDAQGNISSLKLINGKTVEADYYIDASGFNRVLAKIVDAGWHSYASDLSCDSAIPFLLPLGKTVEPLTQSRAMNSGWMWQIPTQERYGCGYVYDSSCINQDRAIEELETTLGCKVEPIKNIKFEPGRLERSFCKNVMFIGLSSVFLEPLQATSIHGTLHQIVYFLQNFLRPSGLPQGDLQNQIANANFNAVYDQFADLVQLHYKSGRRDTEFWRKQQDLVPWRPRVQFLREAASRRWINGGDFDVAFGMAGYSVFIYPILQYGWINLERVRADTNLNVVTDYQQEQRKIQAVKLDTISHTEMIELYKNNKLHNIKFRQSVPLVAAPKPLHPFLR